MRSYHGSFETLSETDLPEYRARGILLRHRKTGCEVYKLAADEVENSFAFVFRTPPKDASGVAHIVEHSVLCGSEAYPVKDSFLVMSRRSLATFLNAFTWPDKTVYPAASAVRQDFWNLLSVYGDAVFHPLLSEETFMQEAHHLEYDEEGKLIVKGVVYNEMRGDYSSADSLAGTASSTKLFTPGHPYSYDSGGDPAVIPSLNYKTFRAFHAERYHPSNCKVFFHGDIPLEEELVFLEERLLGDFEARKVESAVPVQARIVEPRRIDVPYPLAEGAEATTQIVVNWLGSEITDELESFGLELLAEALLGHDGSPLAAALRGSGLGEDLSPQCGIDTVFRQVIFSAGLRGAVAGSEAEVEKLILGTIRDVVEKGLPPKAKEAAIHAFVFSNREVRRDSTTYGLKLLFRSLRGWLHGSGPEATLSFVRVLERAQAAMEADPRWLEGLARKWLLENPHRTTVTVRPEEGLFEQRKTEEERALAEKEASFDAAAKDAIRDAQARLAALQELPDPAEKLALLPMLRVEDLPRDVERIVREKSEVAGVPISLKPVFTNGIVYLELAFPLDGLPRETQVWMPMLSRFIAGAGLPEMGWAEVAEELALSAGNFGASLDAGSLAVDTGPGPGRGKRGDSRAFVFIRLKALSDRFPRALELALRLLSEADSTDTGRVGDLLAELGNDIVSAIVPAGNSFAVARANASFGESLAIEDLWRGTSQVLFVKGLRAAKDIGGLASSLAALRSGIFVREGLRASLSADPELLEAATAALAAQLPRLPFGAVASWPTSPAFDPPWRHEAWSISAQVGYAAAACPSTRFGEKDFAATSVLMHHLTRGALWDELRVRRGAYGASAWLESLEGVACFSTYRDPSPAQSIGWFREALFAAASGSGMDSAMESVIGASGRDLKPLLPEERSAVDFRREIFGITDELRQEKRDGMLACTRADLEAAAGRLAASMEGLSSVLISGEKDIQSTTVLRPDTRILATPL
ncbi:MAG TPA: insulinase family protein [Rectinemataceae bacterium]|nr:insulinase family protein [Rectinemataceae bacterium]